MSELAGKVTSRWGIRSAMALSVRMVGIEKTPVMVLDDVMTDVQPLVGVASQWATFSEETESGYPGQRAVLPSDYSRELLSVLEPMIRKTYSIEPARRMRCFRQLFSMVTRPETHLSVGQRVPHFDTRRPYYFAVMHYLNTGPFGGTGFFRHQPTSYERITDARFPLFVEQAEAHIKENGLPPARYCRDSGGQFELVEAVDYRPNRLLIYPGNLLHSGLIDPQRDLGEDPASGRLTANIFIDFEVNP